MDALDLTKLGWNTGSIEVTEHSDICPKKGSMALIKDYANRSGMG